MSVRKTVAAFISGGPATPGREHHGQPRVQATAGARAGAMSRPLADPSASLARWIGQVDRDSGGWALPRLVQETDYSALFWDMWLRGLNLRLAVGYRLNRRYGRGVAPDPLRPLAFSFQAQIAEAARVMGMNLLVATPENGLADVAEKLAEKAGRRPCIWAWLETYPDRRPPDLLVRADSPVVPYWPPSDGGGAPPARLDLPFWAFQAACLLGKFDRDRELYSGPAAPGDRVLPPDPLHEPSWTPPLHIYAKALLGLGRACTPRASCQCNMVLAILDQPPAAHPTATGSLGPVPTTFGQSFGQGMGPGFGRPGASTRPLDS